MSKPGPDEQKKSKKKRPIHFLQKRASEVRDRFSGSSKKGNSDSATDDSASTIDSTTPGDTLSSTTSPETSNDALKADSHHSSEHKKKRKKKKRHHRKKEAVSSGVDEGSNDIAATSSTADEVIEKKQEQELEFDPELEALLAGNDTPDPALQKEAFQELHDTFKPATDNDSLIVNLSSSSSSEGEPEPDLATLANQGATFENPSLPPLPSVPGTPPLRSSGSVADDEGSDSEIALKADELRHHLENSTDRANSLSASTSSVDSNTIAEGESVTNEASHADSAEPTSSTFKRLMNWGSQTLGQANQFGENKVPGYSWTSQNVAQPIASGARWTGNQLNDKVFKPSWQYVGQPIWQHAGQPAWNGFKNYVANPAWQYVMEPAWRHVGQPAINGLNNYIANPAWQYVLEPAWRNAGQPAMNGLNNYVATPAWNGMRNAASWTSAQAQGLYQKVHPGKTGQPEMDASEESTASANTTSDKTENNDVQAAASGLTSWLPGWAQFGKAANDQSTSTTPDVDADNANDQKEETAPSSPKTKLG